MGKYYKEHIVNSSASTNMGADITESSAFAEYVELKKGQTKVSFHVVITNTDAVGVIYFREKNKVEADGSNCEFNSGDTSYTVSSGVDIDQVFHIESYAKYIEFFYDRTSGNGTCDVYANIVGT